MNLRKRAEGAISVSHQQTKKRVAEMWEECQDLEVLLGHWDTHAKPSTCLLWVRTLLGMMPNLKCQQTTQMVTVWSREAAVVTRKALILHPSQVRVVCEGAERVIRRTILLMWVSVCRHADLGKCKIIRIDENVIRMSWAWQKSDVKGVRALYKFVFFPCQGTTFATYDQTYVEMKRVGATPHSLRRSGMTCLASEGFSFSEIGNLSLHTPKSDEHLAVRRYVEPQPEQKIPLLQIQMSKILWEKLFSQE